MTASGISIILIVIIVPVIIIPFTAMLKRRQAKLSLEVLKKFEGKDILKIDTNAIFWGQKSLGGVQVRGNGVLVLTKKQLYFEMWVPRKKFTVSLSSILFVDTARAHLGKTNGYPLLKVIFQNDKGYNDSIAWMTKDLRSYKSNVERMIRDKNSAFII